MLVAMSLSLAGPQLEIPEDYSKAALGQSSSEEVVLPDGEKR
jgi:hypothetical protein